MKELLLLTGDNEYAIEGEIKGIAKLENLCIKEIEESLDIMGLIDLLNTSSLFDGALLYVLRNDDVLRDKENVPHLKEYLDNPAPLNKAIVISKSSGRGVNEETTQEEGNGKKKGKARKNPEMIKLLTNRGLTKNFPKMSYSELHRWIKEYFYSHGYKISNDAVSFLYEGVGSDQSLLVSEMDKLFLYGPEGKEIRIDDLRNIVTSNLQSNIFDLVGNLFTNKDRMLSALENLFVLKYPESLLLHMIIRELRMILLVKWYQQERLSEKEIYGKTEIKHPYVYKVKSEQARKMSYESLYINLKMFYDVDDRIKSGQGNSKVLIRSTLLSLQ